MAAALIFGLFAWWLYDDNRAERSLLNAVVAAMFLAMAIYGIVVPALTPLFPSAEIARALRNVVCVGPKAAAAGFHEPSLVFMTGTETLLTDGSGAADFLGHGSCRFALVKRARNVLLPSAPKPSDCATMLPPASTAITFRRAGRFRSRSSAPKARSRCPLGPAPAFHELFLAGFRPGAALGGRLCVRRRIEARRGGAKIGAALVADNAFVGAASSC